MISLGGESVRMHPAEGLLSASPVFVSDLAYLLKVLKVESVS
jgi:hypothetical protein